MGSPTDVRGMSEMKLPAPGYSPAMVHGTGMAGSTESVKNPWGMEQMR
jgi:hypothetical protein